MIAHFGSPTPALSLVDTLLKQAASSSAGLQIIVSDDCSPQPFPAVDGVQVVRRMTNGGFGAAVNFGAALARHQHLLVMNSDVQVDDGFIADLVDGAAPWMPAVVSPFVVDAAGGNAWTARHFPTIGHQVVEWLTPLARWRHLPWLHEAVGHNTRLATDRTTLADWAVGCVLLMPTAQFHAVGGFDERFFMNCEEVDLQRRLRDRGLPTVVLAAPQVLHQGGLSSDPSRRRSWLVSSRLRYAHKWGGLRALRASLLAASVVNLLWNLARKVAGREADPLAQARSEFALLAQRVPSGREGTS